MSETLSYTQELFDDACECALDFFQIGWTVCGAEDPAVMTLSVGFGERHPELAGYSVVRVIDKYVSPWRSDTLLEFSNIEITDEEYLLWNGVMEDME